MKGLRILVFSLAMTAIVATSCGNPPKVAQGTVIRYEAASQTLVLKSDEQTNPEFTFSLEGAEVGAEPAENDQVRIAYKDEGGRLVATRVMNLTRQKEMGQKSSH
ncbi:MAG: hypothetical protein AB1640_10195 [bacterium]